MTKTYAVHLTESQLANLAILLDAAVRARGLEYANAALEIARAAKAAQEPATGDEVEKALKVARTGEE